MNNYKRLSEMGIKNPHQIVRYSVSSLNNIDYLYIGYARPKGSLLPMSRTYEFPRVQKKVRAKDDAKSDYTVLESSTDFTEAKKELQKIIELRTTKHGLAQAMLDQVNQLEKEIALHTATLKTLIDEIRDK